MLSEAARASSSATSTAAERDLSASQQDAQEEVQQLQQDLQNAFQAKLLPIIQQVVAERGLTILFSQADAGIVWADPALDLTAEVIKRFDAAAPAATAAPAPTARRVRRPAAPPAPAPARDLRSRRHADAGAEAAAAVDRPCWRPSSATLLVRVPATRLGPGRARHLFSCTSAAPCRPGSVNQSCGAPVLDS